jgi:hypothetical protein
MQHAGAIPYARIGFHRRMRPSVAYFVIVNVAVFVTEPNFAVIVAV